MPKALTPLPPMCWLGVQNHQCPPFGQDPRGSYKGLGEGNPTRVFVPVLGSSGPTEWKSVWLSRERQQTSVPWCQKRQNDYWGFTFHDSLLLHSWSGKKEEIRYCGSAGSWEATMNAPWDEDRALDSGGSLRKVTLAHQPSKPFIKQR